MTLQPATTRIRRHRKSDLKQNCAVYSIVMNNKKRFVARAPVALDTVVSLGPRQSYI